ncbi:MAG TPA: hypothetical protein VMA98_10925 [Candidatus Acidoferrales bacterium]|nr:hypothetical protein [Candidatus Acidoferrales bacterium]
MVRIARIGALAAALIVLAAPAASAETLARLTVTQLTLAADTSTPHVEVPFHLIVTAHVRERVTEFDNVNLPILAELELLGDEHTLVAQSGGTTYRETITVVAHHSGAITIAPVTFDAIDALDGKAKRYFSNALTLHVSGLALAAPSVDIWGPMRAFAFVALRAILLLAGIGALLFVVGVLLRRRPSPPPPVVTLAPATPILRDPKSQLREAYQALRTEPTRAGAMRARHLVRRMVGATDAETLGDVLRRPLAADPQLRNLLRALERAGFTHEADLAVAIAAATAQLEHLSQ